LWWWWLGQRKTTEKELSALLKEAVRRRGERERVWLRGTAEKGKSVADKKRKKKKKRKERKKISEAIEWEMHPDRDLGSHQSIPQLGNFE